MSPVAASRPCVAGCPNLKGKCPTHKDKPWNRVKRMPGGNGWNWQRIRKQILERDGYACRLRLEGCTRVATVVDHRIGIARGGSDESSNLRASCHNCNERKRQVEARR